MNNLFAIFCTACLVLQGCSEPYNPPYTPEMDGGAVSDVDGGTDSGTPPLPPVDELTPVTACAEGFITTEFRADGSSVRDYVYVTRPLTVTPKAAHLCDHIPLPHGGKYVPHDFTTCTPADLADDFTTAYGGTRVVCGWRHEETAPGGSPMTTVNEGEQFRFVALQ